MIKHLNKKGGHRNEFGNMILAQTIDPRMGFNPFMSGKQQLEMAEVNSSIRMMNQMSREQERQRREREKRERQHIQNYLKNYNSCVFADEYTKKKISSLTFQQVKKLEQYNIFLHNLPFKQLVPNPDFEQKIGHNPFYMGKIDDAITEIPGGLFGFGGSTLKPVGDSERNVYLDQEGFFYLGKFFGGLELSQQCELEFDGNVPKSIPDPYFQQPQIRAGGSPIGSPPPPPPPPSLQQPQQQFQQGPPPQQQQQFQQGPPPPPQQQFQQGPPPPPQQQFQQGPPPPPQQQFQQGPPPQQQGLQYPQNYIFKLYIHGNSSKGSGKPNLKKKPNKKPIKKISVKKPTTKKPIKKTPVKKPTTKKPAIKKPIKKTPIKKPTVKKPTVKKPAVKKPTAKKPIKKTPIKKPTAKKPIKKTPIKKPTVKKPTVKKPTAKKPIKKTPVKKQIKKITTKK
jgi:hypothetical protein